MTCKNKTSGCKLETCCKTCNIKHKCYFICDNVETDCKPEIYTPAGEVLDAIERMGTILENTIWRNDIKNRVAVNQIRIDLKIIKKYVDDSLGKGDCQECGLWDGDE